MDLIIKPTQACNFKCTFCSSNNITNGCSLLSLETVFNFLTKYKTDYIIVNGGDPLMVPPEYYYKIIEFINKNKLDTKITITSNLWDFFVHPDKWTDLFNHPIFSVCTSFQYGNARLKGDGTPFSEEDFMKIFYLFLEKTGRRLSFISVTTEENENRVIDTVLLAKDLGTTCKINPALQSGRTSRYYPKHKMLQHYYNILCLGLKDYEFNTKAIFDHVVFGKNDCCPYTRDCLNNIRAMNPEGVTHSCGAFNDDYYLRKSKKEKTYSIDNNEHLDLKKDFNFLKQECLSCKHFLYCNSCYKTISDIKMNNDVEIHCSEVKKVFKQWEQKFCT